MTGDVAVTVAGVRWTLAPAGRALLSDKDLRLEDHLATGRAEVVKHGSHRTVYRIALPTGVLYWKFCRISGPRAWWRDFFRGWKARLEFDRARELASRGIATVEPLGWGRLPGAVRPDGSVLLTRALENTLPLDEHLIRHPPRSPADRRGIARQLGEFVAKLHSAGVAHPDLHPGNLLVRMDGGRIRFFLIDLHDVRLGRPLDREARLQNLVLLNRWFQIRATRTDRLRFWRAYAGPAASPDDARRIERETDRSAVQLWASRDRRSMRDNRDFRRIRGAGLLGYSVRDFDAKVVSEFLADPDGPFDRPGANLLKDSRSATVCRIDVPTPTGLRAMVYKRFRVTHRSDPWVSLFRPPPALRSWVNGHALRDRGLPTPRPWLVLHRRQFGLETVGYLLCEFVADVRNLHDALATASLPEKRALADRLARWICLMHDRGVSHRDLKAANVLVTADGECHFIDLVGVRARRNVSRGVRVRDLTRLNASFVGSRSVTRTDRLRFLRAYLVWALAGRGNWKDWWKAIDERTREKVLRNARRNRPLA
ncbi:MAG TPA: lipopolysaccharide kinase InaA family protein [Gemmataceae bacterium]|nr:lipopolysaccharide kinase InaA family protein [Gemmataceae bacterium]